MLLKVQRNEFLSVLLKHSVSVEMVIETKKSDFYQIRLKDSEYFFTVRNNESRSITAADYDIYSLPTSAAGTWGEGYFWSDVIKQFEVWVETMREEIDAPDLWAEAAKTAQLFAPSATPSDDKFTRTELAEVQGQLRILAQSFTASALPEVAKKKLIELTHTAAVAAETATKRDWVGIIVGSFTGAVFSLALNPTQASEVIKLVKAAFGGLFLH